MTKPLASADRIMKSLTSPSLRLVGAFASLALMTAWLSPSTADEPSSALTSGENVSSENVSSEKAADKAETEFDTAAGSVADAESTTESSGDSAHPLAWTIEYAAEHEEFIRKNVRDYSCRLIKRERIDGKLQDYQFMITQVRCEQRSDGEVEKPLAVFMQYLAPSRFKDRRILYIEGENDGKMLVRKGGIGSFKYVKLKIDPTGKVARRESNYPITDIGFDKILRRLTQLAEDDIRNDPTGENTQVDRFRNAKVNDRICTHIQIVHPERGDGIQFHKASLYIDNELDVPIRLVVFDWPLEEGGKSVLLEEYTYVGLKLNIGLTNADFTVKRLESSAKRTASKQASLGR